MCQGHAGQHRDPGGHTQEATRLSLASGLGEVLLLLRPLNDNEKIEAKKTKRIDLNRPVHKSAEARLLPRTIPWP